MYQTRCLIFLICDFNRHYVKNCFKQSPTLLVFLLSLFEIYVYKNKVAMKDRKVKAVNITKP